MKRVKRNLLEAAMMKRVVMDKMMIVIVMKMIMRIDVYLLGFLYVVDSLFISFYLCWLHNSYVIELPWWADSLVLLSSRLG